MALDVVWFEDRFIDHAAALLSAAHQPTGGAAPAVDLADPGTARAQLEAFGTAGPAVAALRGGVPVGFMAATVPAQGTPLGRVRMQHHAAAPDDLRATYRHLYRALAQELADIGCFEHTVKAAAGHRGTVACLVELGFGFDQVKGYRPLAPPTADPVRQVRLRLAHRDDLADLARLTAELQRFHAEAPMLRPAGTDVRASTADLRAAIDDDRRLVLVADLHGRPAGVMAADPDSRCPAAVSIGIAAVTADARSEGIGTALLSGVVEWAAARGFAYCGAEWTSANLVGDAFWRGHGFVPARYTLTRRIDRRVALDYRHFVPREERRNGAE